MSKIKVNVKWGKTTFKDVEVDTTEPVEVFKSQLYALSQVLPERQKISIPRVGQLKDNTPWSNYNLKNGITIMLVGSTEGPAVAKEQVVFSEDLPEVDFSLLPSGLINTGNTCYLNSTLQVLRNIPEVKTALAKPADVRNNRVLSLLAQLFKSLEDKKDSTLPLLQFTEEFRTTYPQFAEQQNNHYAQQDAEECLSMLLQSLRSIPSSRNFDNIVSELFQGEYNVVTRNVECEAEGEEVTIEPFQKLSCHIKNDTNFLHSALESSLKEHITKNSPILDREAVYEKSRLISKLPWYLTVQYVRFFWRSDTNMRAKICKPVEFPMRLDVYPFCSPDLQSYLNVARNEILAADEAALHQPAGTESDQPVAETDTKMEDVAPEELVNDTGYYQLSAIISHKGRDAEGGHYVAWVRQKEDEWLLFDDSNVSSCTTDDIKRLTGHGGADWHIAYLCIYSPVLKKDAILEKTKKPEKKKKL